MRKILLIDRIHQSGIDLINAHPDFDLEFIDEPDERLLLEKIVDLDGLMMRNTPLPARVIAAAPKLQVISRHGVGCDHIDVAAATARGIPVAITAEANAQSVAEHVMMMILALAKDGYWHHQQTGTAFHEARNASRAVDLAGRKILIMGVGRIGRRVAKLCRAFGIQILGHDPYLSPETLRERDCEPVDDWRAILPQCDLLTVHTPKTPETIGMIASNELAALPRHAIVINCARGGLVEEEALEAALLGGEIRAAGIDVFVEEPPAPDHPLLQLDNLLASPHSAAATLEGLERMARACGQAIIDHFENGLKPDTLFNPEVLERKS